jgi:hypothetical protein
MACVPLDSLVELSTPPAADGAAPETWLAFARDVREGDHVAAPDGSAPPRVVRVARVARRGLWPLARHLGLRADPSQRVAVGRAWPRLGDLPTARVGFEACDGVCAFFLEGGGAMRVDGVACLAASAAPRATWPARSRASWAT